MSEKQSIEELVVELRHPRDWRVRQDAVMKLGTHDTTDAMDALISALYDESPHVVQTATRQLIRFGKNAVSGMLKALYSPDDIASRRFIIHALDDLGDADLVPHFIHFLEDKDPGMRYAAALALTKNPDSRALPHLLNALEQPDAPKTEIVKALGAIGDPQITPNLYPVLFDEDDVTCRYTALVLGKIKTSETLTMLLEASHHERSDVRRAAAAGLGIHNDDKAYERLVEMLGDTDNLVRTSVIGALGKMKRAEGVPFLLALINEEDHNIRASLRVALGDTGDLRVTLPLLKWYRDDPSHDGRGLSGLAESYWRYRERGEQALLELPDALQSSDVRLQICAIWMFHGISFNYSETTETIRPNFQVLHLERFVSLLSSDNPDLRLSVTACLSHAALPHATDAIISRLDDEDELIAAMAAGALVYIKTDASINALIRAIQSNRNQVRRWAIHSLSLLGGQKVIDTFISLLDHDDVWTRFSAISGLGTVKSHQAIPALLARLRQEADNDVRSQLIFALGSIGGQAAMSEIVKMLDTEDDADFVSSPLDSALYMLMLNSGDQALPALYKIVNEAERWQRRMFAVDAIGQIGSEREIAERMFGLLEHENDTVRTTAAKRLGYLGAQTKDLDLRDYIVSNLIDRLQDKGVGYHWNPTVAHMAAKSLYYVGTSEAIAALKNWDRNLAGDSQEDSEV